ncbi:MAG: class I tRNA ligase family protein, partial [Eggerthellaceae bacterium]|nr:class I tRNA ligase family protein [Eggerthellaceae bacterium]
DFDNDKAVASWDDLEPIDKYMLAKTYALLRECEQSYDAYKFQGVYRSCYDFVNELSSVYMDVAKDRLYSEASDSPRRRAVQTVLMNILEVLVRVLAPILSFTCDEVWEHFPPAMRAAEDRPTNVQLAGWPTRDDFVPALPEDDGKADLDKFAVAMDARDVVTKALEQARADGLVKKSQEARVVVSAPAEALAALDGFGADVLEELFIVSGVEITEGEELACEVLAAEGEKCPRCWNYRVLGGNSNHPAVCERCGDALDAIGFEEAE